MKSVSRRRATLWITGFSVLLVLAGSAAGFGRFRLLSWYYIYRLEHCHEGEDCSGLVGGAASIPNSEVRARALKLSAAMLREAPTAGNVLACQELTRACFEDTDSTNRIAAIRLASHPAVGLLQPAATLLGDPLPEVRRAAMLAVGSTPEAITTDDLLHCLHDRDPEVRQLCETALRGRGLQDDQLKLSRLLTDPSAQTRLQVLEHLRRQPELAAGPWLRRLSNDPAAAVRAAALRSAADVDPNPLADRMAEMARRDPSQSVRQLATFYLSCRTRPAQ